MAQDIQINTDIAIHRYLIVLDYFRAIREVGMVEFCVEFEFLHN
jgi:hypothetical protein